MEVIKGRMYDYNNGRFLSVDPFIQNPTSTQSMNPYTYIFNNPLSGTDPSGYIPCRAGQKVQCNGDDKKKYNDDLRKDRKIRQNTYRGFSNFNGARSSGSNPNIADLRSKDPSSVGDQSKLASDRPDGKVSGTANSFNWENGWYANQQGLFNSDNERMFFIRETGTYSNINTNKIDMTGWEYFIPVPPILRLGKYAPSAFKSIGNWFKAMKTLKASKLSVQDKLKRYLLNLEHPVGGSKAKFFKQALGFTLENSRGLAKQIVFNSKTAVQTAVTQYGTKFNQIIPIKGANNRVINMTAAWIRKNDGIVRLVTMTPIKK